MIEGDTTTPPFEQRRPPADEIDMSSARIETDHEGQSYDGKPLEQPDAKPVERVVKPLGQADPVAEVEAGTAQPDLGASASSAGELPSQIATSPGAMAHEAHGYSIGVGAKPEPTPIPVVVADGSPELTQVPVKGSEGDTHPATQEHEINVWDLGNNTGATDTAGNETGDRVGPPPNDSLEREHTKALAGDAPQDSAMTHAAEAQADDAPLSHLGASADEQVPRKAEEEADKGYDGNKTAEIARLRAEAKDLLEQSQAKTRQADELEANGPGATSEQVQQGQTPESQGPTTY